MKSELYLFACLQVDSPMNLKHPHDLVILMRQETTVNYLKELEVRQLDKQHTADTWCISQELEKAMATHSSPLAWKIPWTEEPGRLQSMGSRRVGHDWTTSLSISLSCIGEGNGNPLQCSCLENPKEGGAWWAAVYGVTQSRTRLQRLSSKQQQQIP